eukprot:TRINITY_DN67714_c3_g2_i1.p1 TRINITY_DN67714_c3_g2~~TRINITY_DN67714_c3_g2_i1.p1  ORF type:complete len:133 (-),score=0.19 TRINITY_DN67714_c3_g2_i1:63-461(-)
MFCPPQFLTCHQHMYTFCGAMGSCGGQPCVRTRYTTTWAYVTSMWVPLGSGVEPLSLDGNTVGIGMGADSHGDSHRFPMESKHPNLTMPIGFLLDSHPNGVSFTLDLLVTPHKKTSSDPCEAECAKGPPLII